MPTVKSEVRAAIASQGIGLLDDIGRQVARVTRIIDFIGERIARRILFRPRRTTPTDRVGLFTRALGIGFDALIINLVLVTTAALLGLVASVFGASFASAGNQLLALGAATWFLIRHTTIGRQLYAFGDNPEGARRAGVNIALMQFIAFGWMGAMAGIGGLMQVNIVQEVVPNALIGRELDVLAAVVLGGARLGGGRGSVLGCFIGVLLVAVTQNGLNLMGVSPFAFKMVVGAMILVAISMSNLAIGGGRRRPRAVR